MKITVLDGYTLNPGDLSWDQLSELGELTVHERTKNKDILERSSCAELILTNKTPLTKETIEKLPNLKYIGVLATGYNIVDINAAKDHGIIATNIPAYSTQSVAQMTFAHILNLTQRVACHSESVKNSGWTRSEDFCYWEHPLIELSGLTLGILGFGQIGQAVAGLGKAFGMKIIAFSRTARKEFEYVNFVDIESLFKRSDILTLHCPLTRETENIVNKNKLKMMKRSAFIINTARGQLIEESALADALNNNEIAGAGLDVLSSEPPEENNPLISAKNCFITPHIAWAAKASRQRLMNMAIENVKAFIKGAPQNRVN
jgi:glycerate dehydrogenase